MLATPLEVHEMTWTCLGFPALGFSQGSVEVLSSTKFSLNSCSQAGNSRDTSLCTSSRSPFLFLFSVTVCLCGGFPRSSSLVLPLLSGTGFSVYLLASNTESCDEEEDEVGVSVVEELVDKPGTADGTVFNRGSSGRYTHDPRRASGEQELREFRQEA